MTTGSPRDRLVQSPCFNHLVSIVPRPTTSKELNRGSGIEPGFRAIQSQFAAFRWLTFALRPNGSYIKCLWALQLSPGHEVVVLDAARSDAVH
jgi:hypothetical protein